MIDLYYTLLTNPVLVRNDVDSLQGVRAVSFFYCPSGPNVANPEPQRPEEKSSTPNRRICRIIGTLRGVGGGGVGGLNAHNKDLIRPI